MKSYLLIALFGLAIALNGCASTGDLAKSKESDQNGLSPMFKAFSPLGNIVQMDKGIKITLGGDSLFKVGYSHLSAYGIQKIDLVAAVLMKFSGDHAALVAYTDNRGMASRNLSISNRRADNVKLELVKRGVPSDNVTAVGKGDSDPVTANDTPEGRGKNRRVEITITAF